MKRKKTEVEKRVESSERKRVKLARKIVQNMDVRELAQALQTKDLAFNSRVMDCVPFCARSLELASQSTDPHVWHAVLSSEEGFLKYVSGPCKARYQDALGQLCASNAVLTDYLCAESAAKARTLKKIAREESARNFAVGRQVECARECLLLNAQVELFDVSLWPFERVGHFTVKKVNARAMTVTGFATFKPVKHGIERDYSAETLTFALNQRRFARSKNGPLMPVGTSPSHDFQLALVRADAQAGFGPAPQFAWSSRKRGAKLALVPPAKAFDLSFFRRLMLACKITADLIPTVLSFL
jgi:hypothetical protein